MVVLIFETRIFVFQGKIFSLLCFIRARAKNWAVRPIESAKIFVFIIYRNLSIDYFI